VDDVLFTLWCVTAAVAGGLVGRVLGNIRLPIGGHGARGSPPPRRPCR